MQTSIKQLITLDFIVSATALCRTIGELAVIIEILTRKL